MYRMHAAFPASEGATFDWNRYLDEHLPLAREKLTPHGLIKIDAQRCTPGPDGQAPADIAIATLDFESAGRFRKAFAEVAPDLIANISTFTNVQPRFSFGEVAE